MTDKWELVQRQGNIETERLGVPGGWLYRCTFSGGFSPFATMTFVPEPVTIPELKLRPTIDP